MRKPRLVAKPGRALTRAYGMWGTYLGAALMGAQQSIPFIADYIPWWAVLAISVAATMVGRVIDQGGVDADD